MLNGRPNSHPEDSLLCTEAFMRHRGDEGLYTHADPWHFVHTTLSCAVWALVEGQSESAPITASSEYRYGNTEGDNESFHPTEKEMVPKDADE